MAQKYGFAALNKNLNSNSNNGFGVKNAINQYNLIRSVRVLSIVLDENHPRFKELGEWNGLGTIEYILVDQPIPPSQVYPIAKPYDPSIRNFPLINRCVGSEIVTDVAAPAD